MALWTQKSNYKLCLCFLLFPIVMRNNISPKKYPQRFIKQLFQIRFFNNVWIHNFFVHTTMPINSSVITFSFAVVEDGRLWQQFFFYLNPHKERKQKLTKNTRTSSTIIHHTKKRVLNLWWENNLNDKKVVKQRVSFFSFTNYKIDYLYSRLTVNDIKNLMNGLNFFTIQVLEEVMFWRIPSAFEL